MNFWIFCVGYPVVLFVSFIWYWVERGRFHALSMKKMRNGKQN
jgi:hypothetical protein